MLLCTVRDCHLPLVRENHRVVCPRGHSFDIARSGYVNLLQPQERRSKRPGDSSEAVAARRRLAERGVLDPLLRAIGEMINPKSNDIVLDAGCGEGFVLGTLARQAGFAAHGVDISTPAIDAAARRYPGCHWIVANADRFLPYSEASFSIVLSITARMNPPEFRRVLHNPGRLLVVLPGPRDLIELRGTGRDRVPRTIDSFKPHFTLDDQRNVTAAFDLDASGVADLLVSIYRPRHAQLPHAMSVTFSFDVLQFRPAQ